MLGGEFMKKILLVFVALGLIVPVAYAKTITIKDKYGSVTGYVRTGSGGNMVKYDKHFKVQNYYRQSSNGKIKGSEGKIANYQLNPLLLTLCNAYLRASIPWLKSSIGLFICLPVCLSSSQT